MTKEYAGSGLGLALCKSMAELMNGIIEIDSEPGKGTSARLLLPGVVNNDVHNIHLASDTETAKIPAKEFKTSSKTILIVDDEFISRETLKYMLENNYKLSLAVNGNEAITLFKEKQYDIVLLDIMMPVMDGYKVIDELHKINKNVPVIAITARAMPEDKKKMLEHGFIYVITKPVDHDTLFEIIEKSV